MTKIRVAGALVEVPDGWSVRVAPDGTVELVPGAAEVAPPKVKVRTRETVETREMHYSGTLAHHPIVWSGLYPGLDLSLSQPVQTNMQLTRDPPRLPPPVPKLRFSYANAEKRYAPLVQLVWEIVTPQGGWWRPKAVGTRLGVPMPGRTGGSPKGYVAEYTRVCYLLDKMGKEGHLAARVTGKQGPKARRHYAEPRWAAEHPDDRPVE